MNAPAKTVTLQLGEATITLPGEVAAMAYLERLLDESRPMEVLVPSTRRVVPAFGADFHGGKYAGLTVQDNDPAELVLLPGTFRGNWADAKKWAEEQGGVLPSRFDQLVLFKNLKSEFEEAYYWSSEPFAGDAGYAWSQLFSYGGQDYGSVSNDGYRARAVRRIVIQ